MALSSRFVISTFAVLAGAFLAVSSMAFTASVAGWLGFGVATGVALAALAGVVVAARTPAKAVGRGVLALAALWSLIAALVFSGTVLTWLVFAGGAAFVAIALADLTANELSSERVVHALEVRPAADDAHALHQKVAS